jgi:hypothetical protein
MVSEMTTTMTARGFRYVFSGTLTGTVNNVAAAKAYLTEDDMTKYMDPDLAPSVVDIRWDLKDDGHTYEVIAISTRELEGWENDQLAMWVSGQNSDGLGEGFEQQEFAWNETGEWIEEEDGGEGFTEGDMVSFDWKTNKTRFVQVPRF